MANITGASLQPIYERLHEAPEYHPLEADTFADWALEAGDIVTITRDGNSYTSPVHNSTTVWKKSQQVKVASTGNEERETIAKRSQKKYNRGNSSLRNSQYLHYFVEDEYKQMKAGLELTAISAFLYVDNKYTQMQSGLALTSSTAHLYVDNKYAQMTAGLNLTSSTAKLYVDNKYTQMSSGLALSTSTAKLYVDNAYTQMKSGLELSTSTAKLYVDDKYNQMKSGLALSTSTAKLYVENETTSAKIILKINGTGGSSALISADKISLSGDTTLSGKLSVISGGIATNGNIQAGLTGGSYIRGTTLKLLGPSSAQGAMENSLSYYDIDGMIIKAQVDGNTLKLWKHGDNTAGNPSITFNKASGSSKVSGTWSGGAYTVSANENGQDLPISTIIGKYSTSWDDTLGTWVARVGYENPISGAMIDTGCKFEIPNMGDLQSISIVDDNGNTLTSQTISQAITFKARAVIDNMGYIDHVDGPDITITPSGGGGTHNISVSGFATGPFSNLNDLKENMGYSTVYQLNNVSHNSTGYYGFEVSCGSSRKCYYFRLT